MKGLWKRGKVYWSNIRLNGKRIRRPLGTDARLAEAELALMRTKRDGQRYGTQIREVSWTDFKKEYLEFSRAKPRATHRREKAAIAALEDFFPITRLHQITVELLDKWKARRKNKGIGVATINRDLGAIRTMLKRAVSWKYAEDLDWSEVGTYRELRGRPKFYTVAELKALLGVSHGHWRTVVLLGARAGLRRAEIFWLAWSDIDLKRRMLAVQVKPDHGWAPKDYEPRDIPLSDDLYAHLARLPRSGPWILGHRPKNEDVITAYVCKLARKVGLHGSPHALRHTFASHLAQAGVPIAEIQKLMGHSDIRTTMIYAHLLPSNLTSAVSRLPRL